MFRFAADHAGRPLGIEIAAENEGHALTLLSGWLEMREADGYRRLDWRRYGEPLSLEKDREPGVCFKSWEGVLNYRAV
jgi:hypothetical protein